METSKRQFLFWIVSAFFVETVNASAVNIESDFSGNVSTRVITEKHFRQSADCYWEAKGVEQSDLGEQVLSLAGGKQSLEGSGVARWRSNLTSPFEREIRHLSLESKITEKENAVEVNLRLSDNYRYQRARYKKNKCNHIDGTSIPKNPNIEGHVKIRYRVPPNVWLLQYQRSSFNGIFNENSIQEFESVLNGTNENQANEQIYLWVRPNSEIAINLDFPLQSPGTNNLFSAKFNFIPVAPGPLNLLDLQKMINVSDFNSKLSNDIEARKLLMEILAVFDNSIELQKQLSQMDLKSVTQLNSKLFELANSIVRNPNLGTSIKTAAAIAAYEISLGILKELSVYCRKIEIYLPFSDTSSQTVGFRAAGFWLSRALLTVKNYSFAPFEALLTQLSLMQDSGITYAAVFKDNALKDKIKTSFEWIDYNVDMAHSPILEVQQAVEKTTQNIGSLGASEEYVGALLQQLKNLRQAEDEFFRLYEGLEQEFKPNNDGLINVTRINEILKQLKLGQEDLALNLESNVRLLSLNPTEDQFALFRELSGLLSNQIALLEEPFSNVSFFNKIRAEYFQNRENDPVIALSKACVRGEIK